ncbi:uncharacterized protein LOC131882660 [Tigriopus californicus]|uniref:uncharacterized protein LOC131882660 n=1 Tax=Tigriopus californicus TaxID=6832 RepID=UPI0027D9F85E|nr:uncharacterized protein LOC131882660 [Tigriopus californicus]XP_059085868.1 uncharacterized protein LOC131882660 [Tigriopus californicus]
MAAIISQMAANKRAREKGQFRTIIGSDKCVYTLPPFDPCFDPMVHNKYMKALAQRQMYEAHMEANRRREELELLRLQREKSKHQKAMNSLVSGLAILAVGFLAMGALVFYLWVLLWDVP